MKIFTIFLDWKNQYCNDYTTQNNLQIPCNTYGIFSEKQNNNNNKRQILNEDAKDPKSQENIEEEKQPEEIVSLTSDYTIKLQSSIQYGSGAKIEIQINGTGQQVKINPHTYGQLICDKGGKNTQLRKDSLFGNWCWENWAITCKRMKLEHSLYQK